MALEETKICTRCKQEKPKTDFANNKRKKDGKDPWCKSCNAENNKQWRVKNSNSGFVAEERVCSTCKQTKPASEFYLDKTAKTGLYNKCIKCAIEFNQNNKRLIRKRIERMKNKPKITIEGKVCTGCNEYKLASEFYNTSISKDGLYSKCKKCQTLINESWASKNIERKNAKTCEYYKNKRKNNLIFRLQSNASGAIRGAIIKYCNNWFAPKHLTKKVFEALPYTKEDLIKHLESQFEPWMNWDNYGKVNKNKKTWQIDHIIPQCKLPFTSFQDPNFLKCWSLENLRPLESFENLKKGKRLLEEMQTSSC